MPDAAKNKVPMIKKKELGRVEHRMPPVIDQFNHRVLAKLSARNSAILSSRSMPQK